MMETSSTSKMVEETSPITFEGSLPIFRDHFPGNPLVPAFMQMTAIRERAGILLKCDPKRVEVISMKCIRPLLPDIQALLRFHSGTKSGTIHFELLAGDNVITHGDIRFR
jgi:hypothetical protein